MSSDSFGLLKSWNCNFAIVTNSFGIIIYTDSEMNPYQTAHTKLNMWYTVLITELVLEELMQLVLIWCSKQWHRPDTNTVTRISYSILVTNVTWGSVSQPCVWLMMSHRYWFVQQLCDYLISCTVWHKIFMTTGVSAQKP